MTKNINLTDTPNKEYYPYEYNPSYRGIVFAADIWAVEDISILDKQVVGKQAVDKQVVPDLTKNAKVVVTVGLHQERQPPDPMKIPNYL
jgi:hypothetical protein